MRSIPARRCGGVILSLAFPLVVSAPAALAASATVTGDTGSPTPLGGAAVIVRHMSPEVAFTFTTDEKRYAVQTLGPSGAPASSGQSCGGTGFPSAEQIRYQGNGTYTVILKVSSVQDDFDCAQAVEQRFTFSINAFTSIASPGANALLTRKHGSTVDITYEVPVDLNPGAGSHELRYAAGATLAPDGGIAGASEQGFVSSSTGKASITFPKPGRYTLVARAKVFAGGSEQFTAWSAPVLVNVVAPFDFSTAAFSDARGPSYAIKGVVREPTATGKISISLAKGRNGKKFRRIGSAKIRAGGKFTVKFRITRTGWYTIKYTYKGNTTVAAGFVKGSFRITRTTIFG